MTDTARLAEFASQTRFDAIPSDVIAAAKVVILDGLANAVAGSREDVATKVADYTTRLGGAAQATVVNRQQRLAAGQAAFTNGVAMHCLDYEVQGYPSAHGTSSILPAVAAVAERDALSGAAVLTAFAVGWDIQQRLRAAGEKGDMRGFHPPGVVGPMGAAGAVANLLRLDVDHTTMALGLAASRTGGLFGNNGTMTKATHTGNAARSGIESVDLAALGVTSNPDILRDRRGYAAALMGGVLDRDLLLDGLGERFHLVDPGYTIKPFPAEIYMQWPLDAMTKLKQRTGITLDEVERVIVEPPVFRADLSRPRPISGLDGKFSYEFVVAAALVEARVRIGTFTDAVRFSPELERALKLVTIQENREIPHDKAITWSRVTVRTHDGVVHEEVSTAFEGTPRRPMRPETHAAKISDCFDVGDLGHRLDAVLGHVDSLEGLEDFGELMRLLTAE
jgi:2-methylcitrate dehydratase PrpD